MDYLIYYNKIQSISFFTIPHIDQTAQNSIQTQHIVHLSHTDTKTPGNEYRKADI